MNSKPTGSELLQNLKRNLKQREQEEAANAKKVNEEEAAKDENEGISDIDVNNTPITRVELYLSGTSDEEESNDNSSETKKNSPFYENAQKYWSEVPPTIDGMLGGLGHISSIDIQGSSLFLRQLDMEHQRALDCGAGIGRVSKELLLPRFRCVDMVEQDIAFVTKARELCSEVYGPRIGEIYNVGLQEFNPEINTYDLVWSQWVLGHLTDLDLLHFFLRVKSALHEKGYFVIKENTTSSDEIEIDETDSSVTRPLKHYERLLTEAGFKVMKVEKQKNFPKGLYPVYMIASKRIV